MYGFTTNRCDTNVNSEGIALYIKDDIPFNILNSSW